MRKTRNFIKNINFKKNALNILMLTAAFFVTVFAIVTGSYVTDNETVKVGSVSAKRYVATRTIEDTISTEKLKEEAAAKVTPLYKHDLTVQIRAIDDINDFFKTVNIALEELKPPETDVSDPTENKPDFNLDVVFKIPVSISEEQAESYYELTELGKEQFKTEVISIIDKAFEERITEETLEKIENNAEKEAQNTLWQKPLRDLMMSLVSSVLEPNFIIDEEAMATARKQLVDAVEPVIVFKNQKIVDEGEIVTEEAFSILTELGLINNTYSGSIIPFIGSISIVLMSFIAIYFYIKTQNHKIIEDRNKTVIMFAAYLLNVFILILMADMNTYFFIPVSAFAMLMSVLIKPKTAIVLNIFAAISGLFIFNGSVDFLVYYLITGSFAALLMQYTYKRSKIMIVSCSIGLIHAATYIAGNLFFMKNFSVSVFMDSLYAAAVGVGSVIAVIGSLPLLEAIFKINTQFRLMELTNPNNELMRRLMVETPGTYHHSLIVANLAETAAYDIFANSILARVGSYYHDIGKLNNPQYFAENQFGENVHDHLDPYISARMIIRHVSDGLELAEENKVPKVIKDIIEQHHGDTLVKYFYFKSAKSKPDIEIDEKDFRYKGPIPQSKESAIVMLADSVEAAVRSALGEVKTMDDVSKLIDAIFKDKLNDGQLNQCHLDLSELDRIKKSFLKVFTGMYHGRIAYPKDEEIEKAREEHQIKNQEAGK